MVEGWIERASGRKIITMSHLKNKDGQVVADADGLFLELDPEMLEKLGEFEESY
jgi:hypothetical protein